MLNPTIQNYTNQVSAIASNSDMSSGSGDTTEGDGNDTLTGSSISIIFNDDGHYNATANVDPNIVTYISNNFTINTNKIYRYYVSVQAAPGYTSNLVGAGWQETIPGVGDNVAPSSFAKNTWGYAFTPELSTEDQNLKYSSLPENGTVINPDYSSPDLADTSSQNFKIVFAARITVDKPADHYISKALVSIAAEPKEVVSGFGGVTTMQEFNATTCRNMVPEYKDDSVPTGRLIDTRINQDGRTRTYWVAKLADNKCWMTQNLDFDITDTTVLTPNDSDVTEDWSSTEVVFNDGALSSKTSSEKLYVYNPGYYIQTRPESQTNCRRTNGEKPTSLAQCTASQYGWRNVDGWSPFTGINSTVINEDSKEYDSHYLIGNYYSWLMATLMYTGKGATSQSICPKGWRIPGYYDYGTLLSKYGINSTSGSTSDTQVNSQEGIAIRKHPVYLLFGGTTEVTTLDKVGNDGMYWTANAYTVSGETVPSGAYALSSNFGGRFSSQYTTTYRAGGTPIRCVAK